MTHLICSHCSKKMEVHKTGIHIITMFLNPPEPYQIFRGDLHCCRDCGNAIAVCNSRPYAEHFEDSFADFLELANADPYTVTEFER